MDNISDSLDFATLGLWRATGAGAVFSSLPLLRSTLGGGAGRAGKSLLDWKLIYSNTHLVIYPVLGVIQII